MHSRNLAIPLLAFAGGAVLGRLLGLKILMRGAMTAASVTGMTSLPALLGPDTHRSHNGAHRRKSTRNTARRSAAKRSTST